MALNQPPPDPGTVRAWADAYGLPETYAAIDCETSGLDLERDYVLQLGWCRVVKGMPVENTGVVVGHDVSGITATILDSRLNQTRQAMEKKGMDYQWTTRVLASMGKPPKEAVAEFIKACDSSDAVVAHYGLAFDFPMIDRLCRANAGVGLPPPESGKLFDTAVLFKAAVLGLRPYKGESIASASTRVLAHRGSTKFSVATCINVLNLANKGVSRGRAHDAIYDAWLATVIFETLKDMAKQHHPA